MAKSKDLFDDSTMTFGEHLEALRTHLINALIGLFLGVMICLFLGRFLIVVIRYPIDNALHRYGMSGHVEDDFAGFNFSETVENWWSGTASPEAGTDPATPGTTPAVKKAVKPEMVGEVVLTIDATDLADQLHQAAPDVYPEPPASLDGKELRLSVRSEAFALFQQAAKDIYRPVSLNVQEAFLTYIKVAVIGGLLLSSPWVFYQAWLFVAAGLYPHERKWVWRYLPMSLGLFLGGALFCFFGVFPFVLEFLLAFNSWLGIMPQIRISEWIGFAVTLPLMFGISFQLPLVMVFLERLQIFEVVDYQEKRRMAILVIAFLSMILTPSDPTSMLMMMIPLCVLYEFGIVLCKMSPRPAETGAEMV